MIFGGMEYWISLNDAPAGPYTLQQLRFMWQQGQLTAHTYYFDGLSQKWLLVRTLLESDRRLFTVEEAFYRLGQNRLKGCLSISNPEEVLHLFVDDGFVVYATGEKALGEFALARALQLAGSTYEWFQDATAPGMNLRQNISEYATKHAIARDIRVGTSPARKQNTVAIPKAILSKVEPKLPFTYVLVSEEAPPLQLRLTKMNNLVGRDDASDAVVNDGRVSRKHCLLEVWEQHVKVKDLDSSNGTYVNGISVRDGFLKVGDQLGLGTYKMILQKEQKKAPALE
jgi:hypothetical protein